MAQSPQDFQKLISQYNIGQEPNLTDQELQSRLAAYQGLQGYQPQEFDRTKLVNEIAKRLGQFGGQGADTLTRAENLADVVIANNGLPSNFLDAGNFGGHTITDGTGKSYNLGGSNYLFENQANLPAYQIINNLVNSGYFYPSAMDTSGDVQRLQQQITGRQNTAATDAAANEYLGNLPGELAKGTNAYIQGEQDRGAQFLEQQLAPEIAQSSNVRGMLYSGDLANELSRGASDVFGGIQNERAQLESQDRDYYVNAAYNLTLSKSLQSGQDLTSDISNQRDQSRQQQEYRFQSSQADQERQLQERLMNQEQQRALNSQTIQLKQQNDLASKQNRAGLVSGIGQSVGSIGGALIGNALLPGIGGVIGSGIGGELGQIPGSFQ